MTFPHSEPEIGFEPTTYSLRENCSTPELLRLKEKTRTKYCTCFFKDLKVTDFFIGIKHLFFEKDSDMKAGCIAFEPSGCKLC